MKPLRVINLGVQASVEVYVPLDSGVKVDAFDNGYKLRIVGASQNETEALNLVRGFADTISAAAWGRV